MFHTVCIEDNIDPAQWLEIAKFRWHADACEYAKEISRSDRWGKIVRIESDHSYVNVYFKEGAETVNEIFA